MREVLIRSEVAALRQRLWIAVTAAYIAFIPQIYLIFNASNRYELQWTRTDHLAVLTAVLILGAGSLSAYTCLCKALQRLRLSVLALSALVHVALWAILVRTILSLMVRRGLLGRRA